MEACSFLPSWLASSDSDSTRVDPFWGGVFRNSSGKPRLDRRFRLRWGSETRPSLPQSWAVWPEIPRSRPPMWNSNLPDEEVVSCLAANVVDGIGCSPVKPISHQTDSSSRLYRIVSYLISSSHLTSLCRSLAWLPCLPCFVRTLWMHGEHHLTSDSNSKLHLRSGPPCLNTHTSDT